MSGAARKTSSRGKGVLIRPDASVCPPSQEGGDKAKLVSCIGYRTWVGNGKIEVVLIATRMPRMRPPMRFWLFDLNVLLVGCGRRLFAVEIWARQNSAQTLRPLISWQFFRRNQQLPSITARDVFILPPPSILSKVSVSISTKLSFFSLKSWNRFLRRRAPPQAGSNE